MRNSCYILWILLCCACTEKQQWSTTIIETTASGKKLEVTQIANDINPEHQISVHLDKERQKITGFGGAFTESSAYLLNELSQAKRDAVIQAYFGDDGAKYSLTRTHMNSCDFSLGQYSYAPIDNDTLLEHFSVKEDMDDLIPMIKDAMMASQEGFKIIASPWTAPPWMKDNNSWVGGKLKESYYDSWALFFSKYIKEYQKQGIDIWGITVENEPHGNGDNWESMIYTPQEMTRFVQYHLGPHLEKTGNEDVVLLGYDQNRAGVQEWADVMYASKDSSRYYDGMAVHWYESTYDYFPEALDYAHQKAPSKYLIETEGCVDSEVPAWQDDKWYWSKQATDWGWDWAPQDQKHLHPKYAPVNRYARDIIGCLNHWVDGWIDWNMVLDKQGGPNWFKNWCAAPVLVNPESDEVYFTPLYYVMSHFSKYIRPGATVVKSSHNIDELQFVAAKNVNGSIVLTIFNPTSKSLDFTVHLDTVGQVELSKEVRIGAQTLQTILVNKI